MTAHLSFRTESCGAIVRAFIGDRCLATAIMRRPYSDGPLWTLSRSNGEAAGSHDSAVGVRTALRRVALAYLADGQDMHARASASFLADAAARCADMASKPADQASCDQAIAALESGLVASGAIDAPDYDALALQAGWTQNERGHWFCVENGETITVMNAATAYGQSVRAAMVAQPVQQQQVNASGAARPSVTMQWADEAVRAKPFGHGRANQGECHRDEACGVRLIQDGIDSFTVVYGKQVKRGLSYGAAAAEYGQAVMHALACDAMLDNREPRRR